MTDYFSCLMVDNGSWFLGFLVKSINANWASSFVPGPSSFFTVVDDLTLYFELQSLFSAIASMSSPATALNIYIFAAYFSKKPELTKVQFKLLPAMQTDISFKKLHMSAFSAYLISCILAAKFLIDSEGSLQKSSIWKLLLPNLNQQLDIDKAERKFLKSISFELVISDRDFIAWVQVIKTQMYPRTTENLYHQPRPQLEAVHRTPVKQIQRPLLLQKANHFQALYPRPLQPKGLRSLSVGSQHSQTYYPTESIAESIWDSIPIGNDNWQ